MGCPDDNVLIAMAGNSLEPRHRALLAVHVDGCSHCRKVIEAAVGQVPTALGTLPRISPRPAGTDDNDAASGKVDDDVGLAEGTTINDRYVVKQQLGRGGMGTVYLARDRTLGRDVALKLHRAGSTGDRLHLEAVAMAKLAHPNVVMVFEVAAWKNRLYVAMEYVAGGTLRSWLAVRPRPWREVLDILLQVGNGLVAAHAAGLVHRDFKPENVLVGEDGRPRVSDFGLARAEAVPSENIRLSDGSELDSPITQTGALVGTPAYMAPEQLASGMIDARSDQFAFCVVAWECLFGKRPFEGSTVAAIAVAIDRQEVVAPEQTEVPARVRELVRRGLAVDPDERHRDLKTLLDALRAAVAEPARAPRRLAVPIALAGLVVIGVVVASVMIARRGGSDLAACAVSPDALAGIWDAPAQTTVRTAFARVRPKDGAQIYGRVAAALDDYRNGWLAMRRDACVANRRNEQSPILLDLRMACLDRARDELRELTRGFADPDDKLVLGSMRAVLGLTPLEDCADQASLAAPVRPPSTQIRDRVEAERSELATARALRLLGKIGPAVEQTQRIVARAKELGYRPLEAEALVVLGDLQDRAGNSAAAIELLEQAVVAADAGNHRLVAAQAWSTLAWILGYGERQFDRAKWAVQMANAAIESLGGHPELAAQLANYEGLILETKGEYAAAKQRYEAALQIFEKIGDAESWKVTLVLNDLGGLARKMRDFEASRRHHELALSIRRRIFGENHPYVFSSLNNLGNLAWSQQDYPQAEQRFKAALAVAAEVFPPQHPQRALALGNLASAYERQDRLEESLATYREALAINEATRGPDHPDVADTLHEMGNVLDLLGNAAEARATYERALAIIEKKNAKHGAVADTDPRLVRLLSDLGDLLSRDAKHIAAAEQVLARAIAIGDKAKPDDPATAFALTSLGELYAKTKRIPDARSALDRAMKLRIDAAGTRRETVAAEDLARTQLALANLMWATPAERTKALEMVAAARQALATDKATTRPVYKAVESWLAARAQNVPPSGK